MTLRVVDLRAEGTTDLLGTHVARPRLSWRIEGDACGPEPVGPPPPTDPQPLPMAGQTTSPMASWTPEQMRGDDHANSPVAANGRPALAQHSYRIHAQSNGAPLWDSGEVASDASFDIPYAGPALHARQRVAWSVTVTDAQGRRATSEPAWFETGLTDGWHGDWIEAEDAASAADRAAGMAWVWSDTALDPRTHGFRLDLIVPADVDRAEILVSGKDHLRGVWVDGSPVSLDQPWGYDSPLPFWGSLSPVAATLRPGRASVCVAVDADTTGFFPVDGGAFAALIRLHRAGGTIDRIVSGPDWRVLPDPPSGWQATDFDAGDWPRAVASGSNARGDPRPTEPAMLLRHDFRARDGIVAVRLYATALGSYVATINGDRVSDAVLSPELSVAQSHAFYQSIDVTALVAAGDNAIGLMVGDGWYASPFGWRIERYGFGPAPRRVLAELHIDYADGARDRIATGSDWRIATAPIVTSEIYDGETFDARLATPGWDRAGFDASGWAAAKVGATPPAALLPLTSPPLRPLGERRAVTVREPVPGRFVFDFGQNFSGWARIAARGPAGTTITARFAELLGDDGTADMANLRLARATDRFILAGSRERETFEPAFTYHGFRYVEVAGYPGVPNADDITGIIVHSDCRITGDMRFADAPLLQTIWRNALWSQRSNFFAVPTDCPQRDERMGWMGDIQVFLDAAAFNMEVGPFLRRFLVEARAAQRPDGGYPIVVPQPQSYPDVVTAGWSEAGIILPYQLWHRYGDTAVIDENWAAMERWMAHVAATNPDHVWRNDRGLDLGDWLSVDAVKPGDETTPRGLCATAYWAWCAELMAAMADATGRPDDAARYHTLRDDIGRACAAEYLGDDGTAGNGSQTGQVLALHMGLVPPALRDRAARILADDIRRRGMTLSTGFLGTPYLLDVLADAGWLDVVEGLLLQTNYPSWGYMAAQGATSVWERWNGDTGDIAMNSYNHYAFGAVVGFFYRRLAGIAPGAPGFRRIAVRPLWLAGVGQVEASYDSCIGRIATATDGDAEGLNHLSLTVPANGVADVELPVRDWCEGGHPLDTHPDIRDLREDGGLIRFTVGSGSWTFTAND